MTMSNRGFEVSLSLDQMPERGRVVPEFDDRSIREIVH
jgi:hypothetical protein